MASLRGSGNGRPLRVVLGCDTRESSEEIAGALAGGVVGSGGSIDFTGVVPTPAVAFLTRELAADAGVVISASHNPWRDNGIKIFSSQGRKLPDEVEAGIERGILAAEPAPKVPLRVDTRLAQRYVEHLVMTLPHRLSGLTVVIDAANGAAYKTAVEAFEAAGARVLALHVAPDGRNINDGCGALHPDEMARAVVAARADLGIALDGDADRIAVADSLGTLLDGDDILFLWALELEREGRKPAVVVGTVMSNLGLEEALHEKGIRLVRAAVGDRYVVDEMEREGALLGGEPSGHLIRADLTTTGDGILTGLHLAALVAASGRSLSTQPRLVHTPQVLRNVRVKKRIPFEEIVSLIAVRERSEELLGGHGRILLRYSGTELLARVMVEGRERETVNAVAESLAGTLQDAIGA